MKKNINVQKLFKFDFYLLLFSIILIIIGIFFIYSSAVNSQGELTNNQYIKQILWFLLGIGIFFVLININIWFYQEYSFYIYVVLIIGLILTLLFGKVVRGSRSWLPIFPGFVLQLSEFMKIGLMIYLAQYLKKTGSSIKKFKPFLYSLLIIFIPVVLLLLQPDMGTAIVYFPISISMLFIAGVEKRYLLFLVLCSVCAVIIPFMTTINDMFFSSRHSLLSIFSQTGLIFVYIAIFLFISVIAGFGYYRLKILYFYWIMYIFFILAVGFFLSLILNNWLQPYQKMRLLAFIDPEYDSQGAGWNIIQSKIAIGEGGLWGKGFLNGSQSHLGYLPEIANDFIFSIIAEETGFVGSFFIICLFIAIFYRGIRIILLSKEPYCIFLGTGILSMFIFHVFENIGMTIGIMPVIGISLPFLSYGGSFLFTCIMGIALLVAIDLERK